VLIDNVVPLGFLDSVGGVSNLAVEDSNVVCVGHEELPEALVLGGGIGVGCFPFNMGDVGT